MKAFSIFLAIVLLYTTSSYGENFWTRTGFVGEKVDHLAVNSKGHIFAGTAKGLFRSTNRGKKWVSLDLPYGISGIAVDTDDTVVAHANVSANGGLFRSTDNGRSWSLTFPMTFLDASPLFAIPTGGILYSKYSGGTFRSIDHGQTWQSCDIKHDVVCFAFDEKTSKLYGFTFDGVGSVSSDSGANWTQLPEFPDDVVPHKIAISTAGDIYATSSFSELYRSRDGGKGWVSVENGLPQTNILCIAARPNGEMLVGTRFAGVYYLSPQVDHWRPLNKGLSTPTVNTLLVFGNQVIAGTDGGVWLLQNK